MLRRGEVHLPVNVCEKCAKFACDWYSLALSKLISISCRLWDKIYHVGFRLLLFISLLVVCFVYVCLFGYAAKLQSPFTLFELGINGDLYGMDDGWIFFRYAGEICVFDAGKLVLCLIGDGLRHHHSRNVWRYTLYDVIHGVNGTANVATWIAFDETVILFKLLQDSECVWQIAYASFVFVFVLISQYLSTRLRHMCMCERRAK